MVIFVDDEWILDFCAEQSNIEVRHQGDIFKTNFIAVKFSFNSSIKPQMLDLKVLRLILFLVLIQSIKSF